MELRERILDGTLQVFGKKGIKFTMDDVAAHLGMSKKTIYTVFSDKKSIVSEMVDFAFDSIKESEASVMADSSLSTVEKLRKLLGILPESYQELDFRQIYLIQDKYPQIYRRIEERLETGWENTYQLLEQGMEEGVIRRIPISVFKMIFEASIEQFLNRDVLIVNEIPYYEALSQLVNILMDGIVV